MIAFYKKSQWKRKRERILKRDEYMCQECKRYGKTTDATTVHHIIPLAWCLMFWASMALENTNLISLCEQCHGKMHDRTSRKLTDLGLTLVKRMDETGAKWIEQYAGDW